MLRPPPQPVMPVADPPSATPKMTFKEQLKSFDGTYWWCNWMELVERFAYYGVKVMLPVFMVDSFGKGGPELTHDQKGNIFALALAVQSFIPILSGGFADRYGYKVNIAASTVLKIIGYMIMGFTVPIAEMISGMPMAEARAKGADHAYEIFTLGLLFLAFGTAIFKPGVQGLIANRVTRETSSLAWGLFYQMVNIGGFVGPLLAGYLRILDYEYVFLACSAAIALNFIPLFFFKEPVDKRAEGAELPGPGRMLLDSVRGLLEPRLFFYTIAFCGFWLMNQQFFDILPNFIDDWVDSRGPAGFLKGIFGSGVPTVQDGNLTQEWMLNFNSLLISLFAFVAGYFTGKFRPLTGVIAGIIFTIIAIFCLTQSMSGWWILFCIGLYSVGEMTAAPGNLGYLSYIAPEDKKGQYMGYSNFTVGIGASIGSIIAGHYYQNNCDKIVLARRYLVDHLQVDKAKVESIPRGDLMAFFHEKIGMDAFQAKELLWNTYSPYTLWYLFGSIGLASLLALFAYNYVISASDKNPNHDFNKRGDYWVKMFLVPISAILISATIWKFSLGLLLNTLFFCMMLVFAFTRKKPAAAGE
jgi:proton-dependent oligopeptide transporter, POT family